MKPQTNASKLNPIRSGIQTKSRQPAATAPAASAERRISPEAAQRILISLMLPTMLMPLASSMSNVALPIIRDYFQIPADMTAWVATAFTLPFMMLMSLYGRLSDGLGKRRLILAGIIIFTIGTGIVLASTNLMWLMIGRVVQGIGISGMMPLGMALISSIFPANERGKALGTWSSVGPTTAFVAPLVAGFLIESWGWRAAFAPPLIFGVLAFVVVWKVVPAGISVIKSGFLRTFDWAGVLLLGGAITGFLFFLSSRPITGVAPLRDWRLLAATLVFLVTFILRERNTGDPFVDLGVFRNRTFTTASLCAAMRMFTMAGAGFLIPLYLVDIYHLNAAVIGGMLMINPGVMALLVRFGGQLADRWGSRWPAMGGLSLQMLVMIGFALLPDGTSIWAVGLLLAIHGVGSGLVLAALHRSALAGVDEAGMGTAAGLYSMIRFAGMVIGVALGGMLLQSYLDLGQTSISAYQTVYWYFAGSALIGMGLAFLLQEPTDPE